MKKRIKTIAANNGKKVGALLALLLAGNVAKGAAEEVTGTILFEPELKKYRYIPKYEYTLDTNDDMVEDHHMKVALDYTSRSVFEKLPRYLKEGGKIIYENKDVAKPFQGFNHRPLIAIILPNGQQLELTQLFPIETIKLEFPYLYEKLVREGKVSGE